MGQLEQRIIVDGVMVSDITKFSLVGTEKPKNNAISLIDPKAPDLMMFGMQFFSSECRMKRVTLKPIRPDGSFPLNLTREFLKEPIEGDSR